MSPLYTLFSICTCFHLQSLNLGRILVVQNKLRHILLSKNNDKLCYCTTGETFVTRKITRAVAKIHLGLQDEVNSTFSDKNWGVASLNVTSLTKQNLGEWYAKWWAISVPYMEIIWMVNSCLGNGMVLNFANFCCYGKCMEWKLLFCQDMDKILN